MALGAAALAGACDQGPQHDTRTVGPAVHVTRANVNAAVPLPADGVIRLQVDRFLLPWSVTRQSVLLVDADNRALNPTVTYDPVARIITLGPQAGLDWLVQGQPYRILLHVPTDDADPTGLRAVDRSPLAADEPLRQIGFLAAVALGTPAAEPKASFCADVFPLFRQRCSQGGCHGALNPADTPPKEPAAGLTLDSSDGVRATAMGRAAHGSNTGAITGHGAPPGGDFGVDMPLIDPGAPGNSWLLYKMLLTMPVAPGLVEDAGAEHCDGGPGAPHLGPLLEPAWAVPATDAERAALGDFVLGRAMPYVTPAIQGALTLDELERVRLWIAQGAVVDSCEYCGAAR